MIFRCRADIQMPQNDIGRKIGCSLATDPFFRKAIAQLGSKCSGVPDGGNASLKGRPLPENKNRIHSHLLGGRSVVGGSLQQWCPTWGFGQVTVDGLARNTEPTIGFSFAGTRFYAISFKCTENDQKECRAKVP